MAAQHVPWISPEEFLEHEEASRTKHSYTAGIVTAMAGGSSEHAVLAMNLGSELRSALRGRGCRVVGSDLLFQTGSKEMYTYPDAMVVCGPFARMEGRLSVITNVITNPVFVAEVLSPSSEGFDRGAKSREYRASPTLMQYALLSQERPLIELHTRDDDGTWRISEVSGLEGECEFTSLHCRIPMDALYEGVRDA